MSARLIDQLTQGFGVRPSLRVKRALFGPVDHEENYRFVQRELARNRQEASQRWNYDFSRDVPLPGRYEWEAPSSTTSENHPPSPIPSSTSSPSSSSSQIVKSDEAVSCDSSSSSSVSSKAAHQRHRPRRAQQTQITDYLQHRKRSKSKVKVQERRRRRTPSKPRNSRSSDDNKPESEASLQPTAKGEAS